MIKIFPIFLFYLVLFLSTATSYAFTPDGWKLSTEANINIYIPPENDHFKIFALAPEALNGVSAEKWFERKLKKMESSLGEVTRSYTTEKIDKNGPTILMTLREYKNAQGQKRIASFTCQCADATHQRLVVADMKHSFALYKKHLKTQLIISQAVSRRSNTSHAKHKKQMHIDDPELTLQHLRKWQKKRFKNFTRYKAPGLKKKGMFFHEVFDIEVGDEAQLNGMNHQDWLNQKISQDEKVLGRSTERSKIKIGNNDASLLANRSYKEKHKVTNYGDGGDPRYVKYFSTQTASNKARLVKITYSDFKFYKRNTADVGKTLSYVLSQADQSYLKPILQKYTKEEKEKARLKAEKLAKIKAEKEAIIAAKKAKKAEEKAEKERLYKARYAGAGKGIKFSDIEALLYFTRDDYNLGFNTIDRFTSVRLLLKDGWAYVGDLPLPPSDFNAKGSRQTEPDNWEKWRKNGEVYETQDNKTRKWVILKGDKILANKKGKRLNKNFQYLKVTSSGMSFGYYSENRKNLTLKSDGKFETSVFYMNAFNGGGASTGLANVNASAHSDKEGDSSSVGSISPGATVHDTPATVGVLNNKDKKKNTDRVGRYSIDEGYTLELHRDNGQTDRFLFFSTSGDSYKYIYFYDRYYFSK